MNTPIGGQEPVDKLNAMITAYNEQQRAKAGSAKDIMGRNQAAAQALGSDVGRLGTQEGQQSLLEQQYGSTNYTPGQARLDAWLTGAAANARPDLIGGVQRAYGQLGQTAAAGGQLPFGQAMLQFGQEQQRQLYERLLRKGKAGATGA